MSAASEPVRERPAVVDGDTDVLRLTPVQQRRLAAFLDGQTPAQIARAENVSRQSVAETLAAAPVRRLTSTFLGRQVAAKAADGRDVDAVGWLLNIVAGIVADGRRAVVVADAQGGQHVEMVRDDRVRLDAAFRLLSLVDRDPAERTQIVERVERVRVATRQES